MSKKLLSIEDIRGVAAPIEATLSGWNPDEEFVCRLRKPGLFAMQMSANAVYIVHFFMLGAYSGCVNLLISFLRNLMLFRSDLKWTQAKGWMWFYIGLNILMAGLTWKDLFSIFPCVAMITMTIVMWTRDGKKIRLASLLVNSPAWLTYDIYTMSYSGILCELFSMISVLVSIKRFGLKALSGDEA